MLISDKQWVCRVACRARVLLGCAVAAWSCNAEMRPCWAGEALMRLGPKATSYSLMLQTCVGQAAAVEQLIELREEVDNVIWGGEPP